MEIKIERNSNIDLVKFICAFGVICIHVQNSTFEAGLIGEFFLPLCVPFFFLSALVFFISGIRTIDLPVIADKIWVRVVIPYLFWTVIYLSLIMFKHHLANQSIPNHWGLILFYGASAVQLYYIPKMLIMQVFSLSLILFVNQDYKRKIIGFIVFLAAFGWLFYGIQNNCLGFSKDDYGLIITYLFFAFIISKLKDNNQLDNRYSMCGFVLFIVLLVCKYGAVDYLAKPIFANYFIYIKTFLSVLGGVSLTFLAFSLPPILFSKRAVQIFGFSYGIYLSHVLFLEAFEFILKYLGVNLFYDVAVKLIFSICVLSSSMLFVFLVKKKQLLKKILMGE